MIARSLAVGRRYLARRASPRGAILLYHRVAAEDDPDRWRMRVRPERFAAQLGLLAAEFRVLRLSELAQAARRSALPPRAVAISFDDGYVDNLTAALPALTAAELPATLFAATSFIRDGRPYWWDELEAVGRFDLQDTLRRSDPGTLMAELAKVRAEAGVAGPVDTGATRPLTADELRRFAASPLIDVGAHTRAHVGLAAQSPDTLREEVEGSRADLADWLGSPPGTFAYPFGDHGAAARRAVRRAGYELGAGTAPGPVTRLTDRFELPRLWVEDEGPEWLERLLLTVVST